MPFVGLFKPRGPSGFGHNSTAEEVTERLDLRGKTYLLTGCNSGIGKETLRVLSLRGAHVIAAARTEDKAHQALADVSAGGTAVSCELSEPSSVRQCIERVKNLAPFDGIICNAGIMAVRNLQKAFGYELQFFTNHIGHFILVTGLLDALANDGRVVMVSSEAHKRAPVEGIQFDNLSGDGGYSPFIAYGQSKLANLLFAKQLAKRFEGSNQTANALHPGVIPTNLIRHLGKIADLGMRIITPLAFKNVAQGAATQCFVASHPDAAGISGEYFLDCHPAKTSTAGSDMAMAEQLWKVSEKIVAQLP